jgi:hypothetical protein
MRDQVSRLVLELTLLEVRPTWISFGASKMAFTNKDHSEPDVR